MTNDGPSGKHRRDTGLSRAAADATAAQAWGAGARWVETARGAQIYGHPGRWMTMCGATFRYRADAEEHGLGTCGGTVATCPRGVSAITDAGASGEIEHALDCAYIGYDTCYNVCTCGAKERASR